MRVAIVGFGGAGEPAYRYWKAQGAEVTIHDANSHCELPEGSKRVLGPSYLKKLEGYDLIVRTPAVRPWDLPTGTKVTSAVGEFLAKCPARVIGVTGTNGKSTTAALIARILGEAGWRTWLGGGGGQSPLDFLGKVRANHLVVLELSSRELIDLDASPHIAVCLNVALGPLNWHRSAREYVAAMGNIYWHQSADDYAVFDAGNAASTDIAQLSPGTKIPYLGAPGARAERGRLLVDATDICAVSDVGLLGPHNLENICAAISGTWGLVKHNPEPVRRAVKAYTGLEHRLEFVSEVGRVKYYDDSFSTTPETTIAAIGAFAEPKVVIFGGSEKRMDYRPLAQEVAGSNVRGAVLVGDASAKLALELEAVGFMKVIVGPRTMTEIVASARALAEPGDVVLLSPASTVFGEYEGTAQRGEKFKLTVGGLHRGRAA